MSATEQYAALIVTLKEPSGWVRATVAKALKAIGPAARYAIAATKGV